MRPQPVMPSRSLTSAALRTVGCVRQRDQPAPPGRYGRTPIMSRLYAVAHTVLTAAASVLTRIAL
jgi:hypothetical protein